MTGRRVLAGLGAFLIGGGLVAAGWALQGTHQFLPALLLELGASFFLVVPLLVFERLLSGRIEEARDETRQEVAEVRREVADAGRRLDELDDRYRDRQARARAEDEQAVAAARADVSLANVHDLLGRAVSLRAVSTHGLRVPLDHVTDRVRFRSAQIADEDEPEPVVWIDIEDAEGVGRGGSVIWSPKETIEDVWQRLVEEAQKRNRYPGDGILVPGRLLGRLIDAVERALALKSSPRGSIDLGPVIEFIGDWALSDDGLEHAGEPPYSLTKPQLREDDHLDESMHDKSWVGEDYRDAARVARAYFARQRQQHPPPLGRT